MVPRLRSNTDAMLEALYPRVTAFADYRTGPGHDFEAMVQDVMVQFFPEAVAGILDCLDFRPIETISRSVLLQEYEDRCFVHCCRKVNNRVRASVRRSQRRRTMSSANETIQRNAGDGRIPPPKGPINQAATNEYRDLVWQGVEQLNEDDREAIIIYHFFDQTYSSGSEILDLTVDQLRYRVTRALKQLKEHLRHLVEEQDGSHIQNAQES